MVVVSQVLRHFTATSLEGTANICHWARDLKGRADLFEVFLEIRKVDVLSTLRWTLHHLFQCQIVPGAVGNEIASRREGDHSPTARAPRLGIRSFTFVDMQGKTRIAEAVLPLSAALPPVGARFGADRTQQAVGKLGN